MGEVKHMAAKVTLSSVRTRGESHLEETLVTIQMLKVMVGVVMVITTIEAVTIAAIIASMEGLSLYVEVGLERFALR